MEISIIYQLLTLIYSVILGEFIGLIYDCFKIIRKFSLGDISLKLKNKINKIKFPLINIKFDSNKIRIKHKITYFITDLLFFIFITPIMQIFIYAFSNGIVRWYIFLGVLIGFISYYFTLSKITIFIYEIFALMIKIFFLYLLLFIKFPVLKLKKMLKKIYMNIKSKFKTKKEVKKFNIKESKHNVLLQTGKK